MSLVALPHGKLLGGTTTSPGTGGEKKATEAQLYILDIATKKLNWHEVVFPGVQSYSDLCQAPGGLIYGVADYHIFFVFDPRGRKVVYKFDTDKKLGRTNSQQGPRIFISLPGRHIYMLFQKGIVEVEPRTYELKLVAESPVPIGPGGDFLDGRIYFASGSHLYSYQVPPAG